VLVVTYTPPSLVLRTPPYLRTDGRLFHVSGELTEHRDNAATAAL
jgi:hypothetical protein